MKKIKTHKGFKIYKDLEATIHSTDYIYNVYAPDTSPTTLDSPEWEADNLQECIDFIDSY